VIRPTAAGVEIDVRVIPRASRTTLGGTRDHALLIRLAAPPVEGAANDALIEFLADILHVPQRAVRIVRGARGRLKRVAVDGVDEVTARSRLGQG
jgi:uncharacterized protein (TIGR00251 family)